MTTKLTPHLANFTRNLTESQRKELKELFVETAIAFVKSKETENRIMRFNRTIEAVECAERAMASVCAVTGFTHEQMLSHSKPRPLADARLCFMMVCRNELKLENHHIRRAMGKSPTVVVKGMPNAEGVYKSDKNFRALYKRVVEHYNNATALLFP